MSAAMMVGTTLMRSAVGTGSIAAGIIGASAVQSGTTEGVPTEASARGMSSATAFGVLRGFQVTHFDVFLCFSHIS
jgi:hypothetical protein